MAEYIGREEALAFPFANGHYDSKNAISIFILGCESYREYIESIPAADVRPVVRGKWKTAMLDHEAFGERPRVSYCSVCNQIVTFRTFFCPNCGADMREEKENAEI